MNGETNLEQLLKTMQPKLNEGDYVFCVVNKMPVMNDSDIIMLFKESEGNTIITRKEIADLFKLEYSFIASWITLTVHSSLEAVGLTAAFSKALAEEDISCNVVAAFYHDHIFVNKKDAGKAMNILKGFSVL